MRWSRSALSSSEWAIRKSEFATPAYGRPAEIAAGFQAKNVYLVMTSSGNVPRTVTVLLDGHPSRSLTVQAQRLYQLVSLPQASQHSLTVEIPPGVEAYDFTFG